MPSYSARRIVGALLLSLGAACSAENRGTVDPPNRVQSVSVTPSELTLVIGGQMTLTATPRDAAGNPLSGLEVGWSTTNPSIATVTQDGQVTALAVGSTTITAESEGKAGSATVDVLGARGPSVLILPHADTVHVGASIQLSAMLRDNAGNVIPSQPEWSTSNAAIATITPTGLVTGVAAGTVTSLRRT